MADVIFYGVDRGWMQAQWRDCRDKAEQLKIFRDMVGRNVPPQEILDAVGKPEYVGPMEPMKREQRRWTAEEDARIAEMIRKGCSHAEIGAEIDRSRDAVGNRVMRLRRLGLIEPVAVPEDAETVSAAETEDEPEKPGTEPEKQERRRWTAEEDARIAEMIRKGYSYAEIGAELDRNVKAVGMRIVQLRRRGVLGPAQKKEKAEPVAVPVKKPEDAPEIVTELPPVPEDVPETEPEKPDAYPDGGALPLEIGDLPGADALEAVAETLRALLDEEEMLCARCKVVGEMIDRYRAQLRELLAMAGGGLTDGKD